MLYVIIYFCALGVYCLIHHFNVSKFNVDLFERTIFGLIKESYYIFRVYGLPILLLVSLIYGKISKEFLIRVTCDVACLVSCIIVVTNLLGVSFATYRGEGHSYLIQGNIFDWFRFTGVENIKNYTSIGWFGSGNEISGLLLMTLPVVAYQFLKCRSKSAAFRFCVNMLAMLMIGTKTATIGCMIIFSIIGIMWIIVQISQKNRKELWQGMLLFLSSMIIASVLFYYSPFYQEKHPHIHHEKSHEKGESVSDEIEEVSTEESDKAEAEAIEEEYRNENKVVLNDNTSEDREYAIKYINNNYWSHYVNKQFIDKYPVEKDVTFWIKIINRSADINQNYRLFKKELMSRIIERNGRSLDKIVGVGVYPEIDCEQDYVYQYFMFGFVGVILIVGGYVLIFLKNVILFFAHLKKYWNAEFMACMCALGIGLLLPYVTGHMLGNTLVMFQIVLISAIVEYTVKNLKAQK